MKESKFKTLEDFERSTAHTSLNSEATELQWMINGEIIERSQPSAFNQGESGLEIPDEDFTDQKKSSEGLRWSKQAKLLAFMSAVLVLLVA